MSDEKITDPNFPGSGPFAIPLLARTVSLDNPGHPEFALVRFEFEDGPTVFVPIANQAAAVLVEMLSVHQLKIAEREANGQPRH